MVDGHMLGNIFIGPQINFHGKPLAIRGIDCLISDDKRTIENMRDGS